MLLLLVFRSVATFEEKQRQAQMTDFSSAGALPKKNILGKRGL